MKKSTFIDLIATLLMMMFLYAGSSKYFDFAAFQRAMHNQPFPNWMSVALVWVLPPAEVFIAMLLFGEKTRRRGFYLSILIMGLFTLYIAAILLHFFSQVPCSCGGVIRRLTWKQHLIFNLFFLLIAIIGLLIQPGKLITKYIDGSKTS